MVKSLNNLLARKPERGLGEMDGERQRRVKNKPKKPQITPNSTERAGVGGGKPRRWKPARYATSRLKPQVLCGDLSAGGAAQKTRQTLGPGSRSALPFAKLRPQIGGTRTRLPELGSCALLSHLITIIGSGFSTVIGNVLPLDGAPAVVRLKF